MKHAQAASLDAVLQRVLPELEPIEPPAAARARMRANVLAKVKVPAPAAVPPFFTIRAQEGKWHDIHPGVKLKLLYRDAQTQTFLLEVAPNSVVPSHDHPSHEECLVLRGEGYVGDVHLRAGDYHFARAGSLHTGLRSETGALFLIRTGAAGPTLYDRNA